MPDDLADAFGLSAFARALIDRVGQPGGARQLAGIQALNVYTEERRAGREHGEAIARAAKYLGIGKRQFENRLEFARSARERALADEYEFLRGRRYKQDPKKALELLPYVTEEIAAQIRAQAEAGPKVFSIDGALLECIRRWGYGDGLPDAEGRVAGLEAVLRALRRQGVREAARTRLKPLRQRR